MFHITSLPFHLKFMVDELIDSKILLNAYDISPNIAVAVIVYEKI